MARFTSGLNAVAVSNIFGKLGGNDGFYHNGIGGHGACCLAGRSDIINQQNADFVACEQNNIITAANRNAKSVSIGVGSDEDVALGIQHSLETQFDSSLYLGVGIAAGREVAVRLHLLLNENRLSSAYLIEDMANKNVAGAVERGVGYLEVAILENRSIAAAGEDRGIIISDSLFAYIFYLALADSLIEIAGENAFEKVGSVNAIKNLGSSLIGYLAAVVIVCLVAVVFCGVVAGGNHNACIAAIVTNSPGKQRGGSQRIIDVNLYSVSGKNLGGRLCKQLRLIAAVIRNGSRALLAAVFQPGADSLSSAANGVEVHAVVARAQNASQTACSEYQIGVKTLVNLVFVILYGGKFGSEVSVLHLHFAPFGISLKSIHRLIFLSFLF